MRIEGQDCFTREDVNWTQLQMLKRCDIPGLLPIEIEQFDGTVAFKYGLSGYRMLSEVLRLSRWTMTDVMGALSRLTEVLEDCRLYLLDAEGVLLSDDYIFVGADWHDIRFAYLPVTGKAKSGREELEKLVVRWMARVEKPDGSAMQHVLRIISAPDFSLSVLRDHLRQYFVSHSGYAVHHIGETGSSTMSTSPSLSEMPATRSEETKGHKPRRLPWRLLQPPSGDPQTLSGLLEDEHPAWNDAFRQGRARSQANHASQNSDADTTGRSAMDPHRRRTLVGGGAALISAITWRFLYLDSPGQTTLLASVGITIMAVAAVLLLWNGWPKQRGSRREESSWEEVNGTEGYGCEDRDFQEEPEQAELERFRIRAAVRREDADRHPVSVHAASGEADVYPATTWLSSGEDDQTALLGHSVPGGAPSCYLLWESPGDGSRISLAHPSLVIGRSSEAATHIDTTNGISRAHAEVLFVSDQWKVKDLGSRNGSRLNDMPMTPYELYPLQSGDCLTLAGSRYRFIQEA